MERYFKVSPPSVATMLDTLEKHRLIEREFGKSRSIRVTLPREELPELE